VWLVPLLGLGSWLVIRWRGGMAAHFDFAWLSGWELKITLAVLLLILAITALIAWLAPPNTFDSMRYHMPRVAEWAQNRSVAHYATDIEIQNSFAPDAEYGILHLYVLGRGDRLANFVEWLAMLGCVIGVSLAAEMLGARLVGQMFAALFTATLPMGMIQASSTMNDYVVALWMIIVAAEFLSLWTRQASPLSVSLFLGLAVALATVTKPTAFVYLLPFAIAVPILLWRRVPPRQFLGLAALICATVVVLNAGYLSRNLRTYGYFLDASMEGQHNNELRTWQGIASNVMRNAAMHMGTPWDSVNDQLTRLIRGIHFKMGLNLNDPRTTSQGEFRVLPWIADENIAPNPVHFYLILLGFAASLIGLRRLGRRLIVYELLVLSTLLVFSIVFKWQIFSSRYHLPFFVLFAPAVGAVLAALLPRWATALLSVSLVAASWYALVAIPNRPLIPANGSPSLLTAPRESFYGGPGTYYSFVESTRFIKASKCTEVGLVLSGASIEYPVWPLLGAPTSGVHIAWIAPNTPSGRYADPGLKPCAVICQNCGDRTTFRDLPLVYSRGNLQLYLQPVP